MCFAIVEHREPMLNIESRCLLWIYRDFLIFVQLSINWIVYIRLFDP